MRLDYDYEILSQFFMYDESSPSGLRWRKSCGKLRPLAVAGSRSWSDKQKTKPKCWDVRFQGSLYKVHRIIYCIHNGSIDPELAINHIDNNPFNNRIENLELVTQQINMQRTKIHTGRASRADSTTGIVGVAVVTYEGEVVAYTASFTDTKCGSRVIFTFPTETYGSELALHLAKEARNFSIQEQVASGEGYPV